MIQLGNTFQGKKCARCQQVIESNPAFADDLWYHRTCLEEGTRALQRAQALASRFGFVSAIPAPHRRQEAQQRQENAQA
jgi:hypothetical protein